MIKTFLLAISLSWGLAGCGQLAGAIIAPSIGSVGGEINALSNESAIQDKMFETWDKENNQTRLNKSIQTICHLYDQEITLTIKLNEEAPLFTYTEMKNYDQHILEWSENALYTFFDVIAVERKEFLSRDDCTLYFYAQIPDVSMTVYTEEYLTKWGDKRKQWHGIFDPQVVFTLFDQDRKLIAQETYTNNKIEIKNVGTRGRYEVFEAFGMWYMDTLYAFIKDKYTLTH